MKDLETEIKEDIRNEEFKKALSKLNKSIDENLNNLELLILRGDLFYALQKFSDALNDYNKVLKIEKENKLIISKVEMIKQILKFEAIDIFESTNLNNDPWLD
jgi:tetratricopeptide (TPR) repeat protein